MTGTSTNYPPFACSLCGASSSTCAPTMAEMGAASIRPGLGSLAISSLPPPTFFTFARPVASHHRPLRRGLCPVPRPGGGFGTRRRLRAALASDPASWQRVCHPHQAPPCVRLRAAPAPHHLGQCEAARPPDTQPLHPGVSVCVGVPEWVYQVYQVCLCLCQVWGVHVHVCARITFGPEPVLLLGACRAQLHAWHAVHGTTTFRPGQTVQQ